MINRRTFLAASTSAAFLAACRRNSSSPSATANALERLRTASGGRLGVFALDTGTRRTLSLDPDGRYALCSTFKAPLAAAVLARVDRGEISLATQVPFTSTDLLEYAPVVRAHLAEGSLAVEALCSAAVEQSDNTAGNLLLAQIGGPPGFTAFVRAQGDSITRLDRTEPALNDVAPGDLRDTTTPRAMVSLLERILVGDALSPTSRAHLNEWMERCATGARRLRAGLPRSWRIGDKTGTGGHGKVNDIAIATPPGRAPILVASFLDASNYPARDADALHALVGAVVARTFA